MGEHDEQSHHSDRDLIEQAIKQAEQAPPPASGSASDGADLPPPEAIPGYQFIRKIHRGGQGVVYQALQLSTRRKVAIKVLHEGPFRGSAGRARFEREVQILGQLNHPNIVDIHASGITPSGSCYYVMDYIGGRRLDEYLSRSREEPLEAPLRLFEKICIAVNAAHLRGVIHRDVKPANIRIDTNGEPIVVDFGLAKIAVPDVSNESTPQAMTLTGQFVGSLPWASPEQAEGVTEAIDLRTDVYSLGVILYQILTGGRFPYRVIGNMREVLDNILSAEPTRPSTVRRGINDELETIVLKCLAKDRERRYQSAGEVARDIEHYLRGEPIEAKRDSGWYVVRKTLRRYRPQVGVAAGFLVLLILFAGSMTGMAATQSTLRAKADDNLDLVLTTLFQWHVNGDDRLMNLRGAMSLRRQNQQRVAQIIDRIEEQIGDDPGRLGQLARFHDRIGDWFAGRSTQIAGDTAAAEVHYRKARAIRQRRLDLDPSDANALAGMAQSLRRLAWLDWRAKRYDQAARGYQDAVASNRDAIDAIAQDRQDQRASLEDEAILALTDQAMVLHEWALSESDSQRARDLIARAGDLFDQALSHWARRLSASPDDRTAQEQFGLTLLDRSRAIIMEARERFRTPAILARDAGQTDLAIERFTNALDLLAGARAIAEEALDHFEAIARAHPADAPFQQRLAGAHHDVGNAIRWLGMTHQDIADLLPAGSPADHARMAKSLHAEALESHFKPALDLVGRLAEEDPLNWRLWRDLAVYTNKVGGALRDMGRLDEARPVLERSLRVRRDNVRWDPVPSAERDLALGLYRWAQINHQIAGDRLDADPLGAARMLDQARRDADSALEIFRRLARASGRDDSREIDRLTRLIADIDRTNARLDAGT